LLSEGFLTVSKPKNYKVMEGIIPHHPQNKIDNNEKKSSEINIFFPGFLSYRNGIGLLLDYIKTNDNDDIRFAISGINHENIDFSSYKNLTYYGTVDYKTYQNLLLAADICLSLRDPENFENKFEFPSKVFEFYVYDKIIISTSTYPNVTATKLFYCDFNIASLKNTIETVSRDIKIIKGWPFDESLFNKFNLEAWNSSIKEVEANS
jgi:hypothetical protein